MAYVFFVLGGRLLSLFALSIEETLLRVFVLPLRLFPPLILSNFPEFFESLTFSKFLESLIADVLLTARKNDSSFPFYYECGLSFPLVSSYFSPSKRAGSIPVKSRGSCTH